MSKDDEGGCWAQAHTIVIVLVVVLRPRFERVIRPRIRCGQPATGSGVVRNAGNVEDDDDDYDRPGLCCWSRRCEKQPAPIDQHSPLEQRLCAFDFDRLKLVGAKTEEL